MKQFALFLLFAGLAVPAGDPPGFRQWTAEQLKDLSTSLAAKVNAQKLATTTWPGSSTYSFVAVHREGPGESEIHETQADFMVVQSGEGTLIVGGTLEGARNTGAGEVRGTGVKDGIEKKLKAGDIAIVPSKTPHWVIPGSKEITYFLVKINQP
jgi:mannose-6-phosphate isomerase-like protein (cupin superfamily)